MITILHGENKIKSRDKLVQIIASLQDKNQDFNRLDAKKITLPQLEKTLAQTSLFGTTETVLIEGIHSLPRSKKKDALIAIIPNAQKDVVLWEKRVLTPTMLKKFPSARVELFKLTNSLFSWLYLFSPQTSVKKHLRSMDEAIQANGEHMCFVMLMRQIRLLIQVKDGGKPGGAPFMIRKLQQQAQYFSLDQLLEIHSNLFEIDQKMKSSKGFLSLKQDLDLLGVSLYS